MLREVTGAPKDIDAETLIEEAALADQVVHSQCLANFMIPRALIWTGGLTNAQVVQKLQAGSVRVDVAFYADWGSNVLGYRDPNSFVMHKNLKYYLGASPCDRASNDAHEVSHMLDFDHAFRASRSRPYSVPYSINEAFAVCCHGAKASL